MNTQVDAMIEESGLDPIESEQLAAFLTMVGSMVQSAPVPSAALASLLSGGAAGTAAVSLAARRHQNALAAAVLALSGIVVTGVAAAANDLPPTAQRLVAEFSQRFLPYDFPFPERRAENLTGQTDHILGQVHDPDRMGGPGEGVDDGEASTDAVGGGTEHSESVVGSPDGREADDDSGPSPDSREDADESGTQTSAGEGDDPDDSGSGDPGESSSGDDATDAEELDAGTGDTSGESGGDYAEPEDETRDSTEAIDD